MYSGEHENEALEVSSSMSDKVRGSYDWIRSQAQKQISKMFQDAFVREVFPESVVVEDFLDGALYELDYKVDGKELKLGDKREIQLKYVALKRRGVSIKAPIPGMPQPQMQAPVLQPTQVPAPPPPPPPDSKPGQQPEDSKPKQGDAKLGTVEGLVEQLQKTSRLIGDAKGALASVKDVKGLEDAIASVRVAEGHLALAWSDGRSLGEDEKLLAQLSQQLNDERSRVETVLKEARDQLQSGLLQKAASGDKDAIELYYAMASGDETAEGRSLEFLKAPIEVGDTSAMDRVTQMLTQESERLGG